MLKIHLDGYVRFRRDSCVRRGGGILVYIAACHKPSFGSLPSHVQSIDGFEAIYCELHHTQSSLQVLNVCRSRSASAAADLHLFNAIQFESTKRLCCPR